MALLWKTAVEACECGQTHPTEESVQHVIDHYGFADAYPSGASGPEAWKGITDNYIIHDPHWQKFRKDLSENGVKRPIRIDYHHTPPMVIDGHSRLLNAHVMGMEKIPVKHGEWWDVHSFPDETQTREV